MSLFNSIKKLTSSSKNEEEEAKMRFSLTPGETGFSQWLDAMKMCAQLSEGMPPEFRTKLWLQLSEKHLQDKKIDWVRTEKIIFSEWSNPDDEELGVQIVKDLHRTGCSLFCGAQGEQNQALLKRVLLAYARWNKSVGYCQGFNMLGAIILQVMDRDEKNAVKVMIYLIDGVLPESYFANNLRGLSVDMAVFRDLMKLRLPKLSRHLEALQQDTSSGSNYEPPLTNVFTMQWFLTLFSNCLPQATVLRVWDLVFLYGNEVLLRTALAIWGILQDRVISVESADEFYCIMGVVTREMLEFGLMDANNLVKTIAMVDPFPNELQELRDKYLYNISPWTQSVQSVAKRGFRLFHSDNEDQDDTEDEATAKALAAAHGVFRRRESTGRDVAHAGPTLDISILKQQYAKLLQRQRQAHVIISAACSGTVGSPSVAVNHLLAGKSALVAKTRRIGPPEGAVPPPVTHPKSGKKIQPQKSGEKLQWKDAPDLKSDKCETKNTRWNSDRVTETSVEESFRKKELKQRSSSSSSSSTELCDDDLYKSDLDSEETSESLSSRYDKKPVADSRKLESSGKLDQQFSESIRDVETLTKNIAREEKEDLEGIRLCALQVVDDIEERLEAALRLRNSFPVDPVIKKSEKSPVDEPSPFSTEIMPSTVDNPDILTKNAQQDCFDIESELPVDNSTHRTEKTADLQLIVTEKEILDSVDEITRLKTRLNQLSNNSIVLEFEKEPISSKPSTEINEPGDESYTNHFLSSFNLDASFQEAVKSKTEVKNWQTGIESNKKSLEPEKMSFQSEIKNCLQHQNPTDEMLETQKTLLAETQSEIVAEPSCSLESTHPKAKTRNEPEEMKQQINPQSDLVEIIQLEVERKSELQKEIVPKTAATDETNFLKTINKSENGIQRTETEKIVAIRKEIQVETENKTKLQKGIIPQTTVSEEQSFLKTKINLENRTRITESEKFLEIKKEIQVETETKLVTQKGKFPGTAAFEENIFQKTKNNSEIGIENSLEISKVIQVATENEPVSQKGKISGTAAFEKKVVLKTENNSENGTRITETDTFLGIREEFQVESENQPVSQMEKHSETAAPEENSFLKMKNTPENGTRITEKFLGIRKEIQVESENQPVSQMEKHSETAAPEENSFLKMKNTPENGTRITETLLGIRKEIQVESENQPVLQMEKHSETSASEENSFLKMKNTPENGTRFVESENILGIRKEIQLKTDNKPDSEAIIIVSQQAPEKIPKVKASQTENKREIMPKIPIGEIDKAKEVIHSEPWTKFPSSKEEPQVRRQIDRNRRKTDLAVSEWKHSKKYNINVVYEILPKGEINDDTTDLIKKDGGIAEKLAVSKNEWETKMKRIAELDSATRAKISELNRRDCSSSRYRGRSISPSLSRPNPSVVTERKKLKVSTLSFDEITSRTEKLLRDSECSTPDKSFVLEAKVIKTPLNNWDLNRTPSPVAKKVFSPLEEDASYFRSKNSTSKFKKLIEESYGPSEDEYLALPKKFQAFSSPTSPEPRFKTKIKYSEFVSPRRFEMDNSKRKPKEPSWPIDDADEYISVTSYDSKLEFTNFETSCLKFNEDKKSPSRNELKLEDGPKYVSVFEQQKSTNSSPDRKRWDRKYLSSPEEFPVGRKNIAIDFSEPWLKKSTTLSPEDLSRHSSPRKSLLSPDAVVGSSKTLISPDLSPSYGSARQNYCPFPPRSPQRPKDIAVKLGLYKQSGEIFASKNS